MPQGGSPAWATGSSSRSTNVDVAGSNVVDAQVKSLRRKLGPRAGAIKTVRGLGYRFVASA